VVSSAMGEMFEVAVRRGGCWGSGGGVSSCLAERMARIEDLRRRFLGVFLGEGPDGGSSIGASSVG
jgi:hypothetical protein